jgi:hypothetical protein
VVGGREEFFWEVWEDLFWAEKRVFGECGAVCRGWLFASRILLLKFDAIDAAPAAHP